MSEYEKCGATQDCLKNSGYPGLIIHSCDLPKGHDENELHAEFGVRRFLGEKEPERVHEWSGDERTAEA
jgi:hypothetical protein